jgi:MFS superfamily sulfate permease-like transporter
MLGVIGLGVLRGVLIAIVAAGIYLLARVSRPSDALLGCIPGRDGFYKVRHAEPEIASFTRLEDAAVAFRKASADDRVDCGRRSTIHLIRSRT